MPVAEAEGAVLAHAVRRDGLTLKKGHVLGSKDVHALSLAGVASVTACRLEIGDVAEDEAAARLAGPLARGGLEARAAFTGRANLFAQHAGVLRVDAGLIDAVNGIDEALTVATLPDFAPVQPGQLVVTVKIIPFAVPDRLVTTAEAKLGRTEPPLRVHAFRGISAFLVQTTLPGLKASVLDKTAEITRDRVRAVGGRLLGEARCSHDAVSVAATLDQVPAVDVLLLAGASAIADRLDVLPTAIEASGGRVLHFGMPVDPGNLLLLADRAGTAVIGLPGCARSPKLNGFDWVLRRLAAGLRVDSADIMGLGVGGLLGEIESRPQPREGAPLPTRPRVACVVLAAGRAQRMGGLNKLVAKLGSKPLLAHAVDAALVSRAVETVVVTGHERDRVEAALTGRAVRFVNNNAYANGLATSLQAGLSAIADDIDGVLVCLGDMPKLTHQHMNQLIAAFAPGSGRSVVVPTVDGKRGNPVLWGRRHFAAIQALVGDVGARHLIGENAQHVVEVPLDDAALVDVDTPAALEALRTGHDR